MLHVMRAPGAPAAAPVAVGVHYFDTTNKVEYISYGTASVADWVRIEPVPAGGADATVLIKATAADYDDTWALIVDENVDAAAALARSKLAAGTAYRVVANSSAGVLSENAALTAAHNVYVDANGQLAGEQYVAKTRGGTGTTSTATFPASGVVTTDDGTSVLENKSLEATCKLVDTTDNTKTLKWDLAAQSTGVDITVTTGAETVDRVLNIPVLGGNRTLALTDLAQVLENKDLEATCKLVDTTDNTKTLKWDLAAQSTGVDITLTTSAETADRVLTLPVLGGPQTLVLEGLSQVLTNKTIDSASNTITNIDNGDVSATAAIARSKLADGTAYRVLANSSAGVMSENAALTAAHAVYADTNGQLAGEAYVAKTRGGTGITSTATFPGSGVVTTDAGTSVLENKSLEATCALVDTADNTKTLKWNLAAQSAGVDITVTTGAEAADRVLNIPVLGADRTVVLTDLAQVIENKELEATCKLVDTTDNTKTLKWDLAAQSTGVDLTLASSAETADRRIVVPVLGADRTLVLTDLTQDLTNKSVITDLKFANEASAKFYEASGTGTNFVALKAPASVAADKTFVLPGVDGTSGQALVTDGSGALSWADAGSGSGTGEKNYISAPSDATGWGNVGDLDVATTTTASELPREFTTSSGIKITADANPQTAADLVFFDFTLDDVDQAGRIMKLKWDQKPVGTYAAGEITVVIMDQTHTSVLVTPFTTAVPSATGSFETYFLAPSTAAASLVLRSSAGLAAGDGIVISDVVVGPNAQVQGVNDPIPPTIQTFNSGAGTYTTPSNVKYIRIRAVGGGGGGGGSGTAGAGAGGSGGNSTFGVLTAGGGGGNGAGANVGGAGGSASLGSGPIGTAIAGSSGLGFTQVAINGSAYIAGGIGGDSPLFCGSGKSGVGNSAGAAGTSYTGGGGQGGGSGSNASNFAGGGGGSGGYVEAIISSPASSYSYSVGAAGSAGSAGTYGFVGGAGGGGYIEVTEYYYPSNVTLLSNPNIPLEAAGAIQAFAGSTAPKGWAICDGAQLASASYPDLYAAIGTTWDTATDPLTGSAQSAPSAGNFRIPNLRGAFLRGSGGTNAVGVSTVLGGFQADATNKNNLAASLSSGTVSGTVATTNIDHAHHMGTGSFTATSLSSWSSGEYRAPWETSVGGGGMDTGYMVSGTTHGHTWSGSVGTGVTMAGTDPETRPDNIGVNYIIRLFNSGLGAGACPISSANIVGRTDGVAPATGMVGEYKESVAGSGESLSNITYADSNVTGLVLQPGTWDLQATVSFLPGATTNIIQSFVAIGTASGNSNAGNDPLRNTGKVTNVATGLVPGTNYYMISTPVWRVNISTATTYYCKSWAQFSVSTLTAQGALKARRVV